MRNYSILISFQCSISSSIVSLCSIIWNKKKDSNTMCTTIFSKYILNLINIYYNREKINFNSKLTGDFKMHFLGGGVGDSNPTHLISYIISIPPALLILYTLPLYISILYISISYTILLFYTLTQSHTLFTIISY